MSKCVLKILDLTAILTLPALSHKLGHICYWKVADDSCLRLRLTLVQFAGILDSFLLLQEIGRRDSKASASFIRSGDTRNGK